MLKHPWSLQHLLPTEVGHTQHLQQLGASLPAGGVGAGEGQWGAVLRRKVETGGSSAPPAP